LTLAVTPHAVAGSNKSGGRQGQDARHGWGAECRHIPENRFRGPHHVEQ
jgi:hypothetical protein